MMKGGSRNSVGELINFARDVTLLLFSMRMAMKNCPASQGDEPRRGGGGLTPTGTTPDASTDNINGSEKGEKLLLCMGNPSGPSSHLPCKGGH